MKLRPLIGKLVDLALGDNGRNDGLLGVDERSGGSLLTTVIDSWVPASVSVNARSSWLPSASTMSAGTSRGINRRQIGTHGIDTQAAAPATRNRPFAIGDSASRRG